MAKNSFVWVIIFALGSYTLWSSFQTARKVYGYYSLNKQTPITHVEWSIKAINDERYHLKAAYQFQVAEHSYTGLAVISYPYYRNPWAAEKGVEHAKKETHQVWYNANDPSFNSLERIFPLKETIYNAMMWAVSLYFIGLGIYLVKNQDKGV